MVTVNQSPDSALQIAQEREVLFQFVPVDAASKAIAAFPNGYFQSDLNPMQNYVFAQHLEARYGLSLFGIGSCFLGFRRDDVFREELARQLATELAAFYADTPTGAVNELTRLLTGRDWVLTRYTES